jgi:hypothetical protein
MRCDIYLIGKTIITIMPAQGLSTLCLRRNQFTFIPIKISKKPKRQSLNILNPGIIEKGFIVPSVTKRLGRQRMKLSEWHKKFKLSVPKILT